MRRFFRRMALSLLFLLVPAAEGEVFLLWPWKGSGDADSQIRMAGIPGISSAPLYSEKLTVAQFEARMRKHLPMEMYQEARRRTQGKTTPATAFNKTIRFTMCAVFVKAYNKQLRTNSPNRLELEWDHEDEE